MTVFLSYR